MEEDFSLRKMMDLEHLQKLSDRFCEVTDVFAYGVDKEGKAVTNLSGNPEEAEIIWECLDKNQVKELVDRVKIGSLEEMAVESTEYADMKVAAVAVWTEKERLMTWVVCGIMKNRSMEGQGKALPIVTRIEEKKFYHVLDVLRDISHMVLENHMALVNERAKSAKSRQCENEMGQTLKRNEATARIVRLLEDDAATEDIIEETLQITGTQLDVSYVQVLSVERDKGTMDIVGEWCKNGMVSFFDRTKGLEMFSFLTQDKPLVISADSFEASQAGAALSKYGIKALTVFPVTVHTAMVNGKTSHYLCIMDKDAGKTWRVEEIKLIRDCARLLQIVVQRQAQANSLAGSRMTLESILDNLSCGVYMRDLKTKEELFANRNLKDVFEAELSRGTLDALLDKGIARQKESGNSELYYKMLCRWYRLSCTHISWVDGREAELFCLYDITETKISQRRMESNSSDRSVH